MCATGFAMNISVHLSVVFVFSIPLPVYTVMIYEKCNDAYGQYVSNEQEIIMTPDNTLN